MSEASREEYSHSFDFKAYLATELKRRLDDNPRYSMRAFARTLGLESSYLSKILRGKRPVTERLIQKCSDPLGLNLEVARNFVSLARSLKSNNTRLNISKSKSQTLNHTILSMAIESDRVMEVERLLSEFRFKFLQFAKQQNGVDGVYHISLSYHPFGTHGHE
jgi:transcriptional regulator with XRE-family HTH domain